MIRNKRSHNIAYRCYNIWNVGDFSVESEESNVCWPSPTITICSPLTVQGKPLIRDPNVFHLKMVRPGLQSFRLPVRESKENARYNNFFLKIYLFSITHQFTGDHEDCPWKPGSPDSRSMLPLSQCCRHSGQQFYSM